MTYYTSNCHLGSGESTNGPNKRQVADGVAAVSPAAAEAATVTTAAAATAKTAAVATAAAVD